MEKKDIEYFRLNRPIRHSDRLFDFGLAVLAWIALLTPDYAIGAMAQTERKEAANRAAEKELQRPKVKTPTQAPDRRNKIESKSIAASETQVLTLGDYLKNVSENHDGAKASRLGAEAARLQGDDADLLTSPQLVANTQHVEDAKPNPMIGPRLENTLSDSATIGIQQLTEFGLSGKLTYTLGTTELRTIAPKQFEARPTLELSQSLWRNGFGSETRAQKKAIESGALAKSYGETFRNQALLLEAEANYWGLALARETVQVQKEALVRADKLYDWSSRRSRLGLSDRAEMLQAQANQQARRLELRISEDTEEAAQRAFNRSRGATMETPIAPLQPITRELIERMDVPGSIESRYDVRAAEQQMLAIRNAAQASKEKTRPTLDIFGSVSLNGNDTQQSPAINESFGSDRPTTVVGVRLIAPLDFGSAKRAQEGWEKEKVVADYNYSRKVFEEKHDWANVTQRFREAKQRLKLYHELEEVQKTKLDYERDRQSRGRTTTQQVLLFELDYEQAQFGRIRTLADILQLNAQMKLYGVNNESR